MKYGLVYYKQTDNLGDDILSFAAKQFLPHIDYLIDREALDTFLPDQAEEVLVILNGWFLHRSFAFPPSPYILPLFVGIHFSTDHIAFGDYSWLDGFVSDYLSQFQPIGCRDTNTLNAMQERNIESFFSGCLTMTLKPFSDIAKKDYIVLTDVDEDIYNYIQNLCPQSEIIRRTHTLQRPEQGASWSLRQKRVEEYLTLYQGARLIITTRLHCALPAVALGTPVILTGTFDDDFSDRIADYAGFCKTFDKEGIISGHADDLIVNGFINSDITELQNKLNTLCRDFIEHPPQRNEILPDREQYLNLYIRRTHFIHKSIEQLFNSHIALQNKYLDLHQNYLELSDLSQRLMSQYQHLLEK